MPIGQHGVVIREKGWGAPATALTTMATLALFFGLAYVVVARLFQTPRHRHERIPVPTIEAEFGVKKRGKRREKKPRRQQRDNPASRDLENSGQTGCHAANELLVLDSEKSTTDASSLSTGKAHLWLLLVECEHCSGILLGTQRILKEEGFEMDDLVTASFVRANDVWFRMSCSLTTRTESEGSHTKKLVHDFLTTTLQTGKFTFSLHPQPEVHNDTRCQDTKPTAPSFALARCGSDGTCVSA